MNSIDVLREYIKRKREYASFFDWFDKGQKELGVVESLLGSMKLQGANTFQNLYISPKDPPDCIAKDQSSNLIGIEVTELVDEDAVRLNAQGKNVYRKWTADEVVKEIESIIVGKDSNTFHGGPYKKLILVIHTDELDINFQALKPMLEIHEFKKTSQITEAYLLFSYDPTLKYYPYIQLKLTI